MLPKVCPLVLKTAVLVRGCEILTHGGTEDVPCERSSWVPVLVTGAIPQQGFVPQESADKGTLFVCWHVRQNKVLIHGEDPVTE